MEHKLGEVSFPTKKIQSLMAVKMAKEQAKAVTSQGAIKYSSACCKEIAMIVIK